MELVVELEQHLRIMYCPDVAHPGYAAVVDEHSVPAQERGSGFREPRHLERKATPSLGLPELHVLHVEILHVHLHGD